MVKNLAIRIKALHVSSYLERVDLIKFGSMRAAVLLLLIAGAFAAPQTQYERTINEDCVSVPEGVTVDGSLFPSEYMVGGDQVANQTFTQVRPFMLYHGNHTYHVKQG